MLRQGSTAARRYRGLVSAATAEQAAPAETADRSAAVGHQEGDRPSCGEASMNHTPRVSYVPLENCSRALCPAHRHSVPYSFFGRRSWFRGEESRKFRLGDNSTGTAKSASSL